MQGLRRAAFDALETVVDCTADTMPMVSQLLQPMMQKLTETLAMPASTAEERQRQADQQSLYCGVLQTIIHKLSEEDTYKAQMIANFADPLMVLFLQVIGSPSTRDSQHDPSSLNGDMQPKAMRALMTLTVTIVSWCEMHQRCAITTWHRHCVRPLRCGL